MTIPQGTRLGHYEIQSLLGKGGMGEVYLAHDSRLRRNVALKILPDELTQQLTENRSRLARFEREAYAASALNHPNILTIYEIGEHAGTHFIASEYVEGVSLRQHMMRGDLALREALDISSQVAAALAAAHHAGIVHRDIKPENIMVRKDGFIKVLDFGLAKLIAQKETGPVSEDQSTLAMSLNHPVRPSVTSPGTVIGTVSYMSPEQARGLEVDERTDLWSLGVVLYELVCGKLPFAGPTTTDVLATILQREPTSLLVHRPDLPAELERIVEKLLTKDKDERYQLAKDLGSDLKRLKQRLDLDVELKRSITPDEEMRRRTIASKSRDETQVAPAPATATAVHATSSTAPVGRNKLAMVIALLVLAGLSFAYYKYSRSSRSEAISSVAILPFANAGGDQEMEYLSDGLSESIINNLSQMSHLKVISRGSVFKYKGKEVDVAEVARALNVQAVVTGRVVQVGDQLQVSAELVNVRDKTQLWGEQYNRKASDLLAVQAEISQQIAQKLRLRLTNAEQQQLVKESAANPQAYELLLKSRYFMAKATREDLKKALDYSDQALEIDRNYAPAYVQLAACHRFMATNSYQDPKEAIPKAEAAVRKALELNDSLAEAHSQLAAIKLTQWDWPGAEREFKRALDLNANLVAVYNNYAGYLSSIERHEEAIAATRKARELDPLSIRVNASVGYRYFFARRYDEAIAELKSTVEMDRNSSQAHAILGYTYAALGQFDKALEEYRIVLQIDGQTTSDSCYVGYALAKSGKRAEAEALLKELKSTKEYVSPVELAVLYVGLADIEGALASIEKGYAEHDLQLQFVRIDPHFDSLRDDPRFQDMLRKLGLP